MPRQCEQWREGGVCAVPVGSVRLEGAAGRVREMD